MYQTPPGRDEHEELACQAARHWESFAYFILLFRILLGARERAWVITAPLFVAAGMALISFELVMSGLVMC